MRFYAAEVNFVWWYPLGEKFGPMLVYHSFESKKIRDEFLSDKSHEGRVYPISYKTFMSPKHPLINRTTRWH
jgi:hypothetical protein